MLKDINITLVRNVLENQDISYLGDSKNNEIIPYEINQVWHNITVNEFCFKLKDWVLNNGYFLFSGVGNLGGTCEIYYKKATPLNPNPQEITAGESNPITEQEAIIKAGNFILEKLKALEAK